MATRVKPKKKLNKAWLHDHLGDPWVKLAQQEGYRARAAYKLKQIDEALGLLKPGQLVVDLGASPGAWSQYIRRSQPDATVIALDLLEMAPVDGVHVIRGDFRELEVLQAVESALAGRRVDVVVSDMAPNLSGVAVADAARMTELVELAVEFAAKHLKPAGALVCKVFHGSGYSQLVETMKGAFRTVKVVKPKASRPKSAETFLVGMGLKQLASAAQSAT